MHTTRIRVRYGETDAMGWVYYATYLCYFEVGRTELIRALWKSYREIEDQGYILPVVEARCRYYHGARYDDELEVKTEAQVPSPARIQFDYVLTRVSDARVIAVGLTQHCFLDRAGRIVKVPDELKSRVRD